MLHPPYSVDLWFNDNYLFPKLKENSSGQHFWRDDEVKEEVKCFFNGLAAEIYDIPVLKLEYGLPKRIKRMTIM